VSVTGPLDATVRKRLDRIAGALSVENAMETATICP
jgi:hypothetical protein